MVDLFHLVTDFSPNAGSVRFLRACGVLNGTFIPDLWLPDPIPNILKPLENLWGFLQSFGLKIQQA